MEKGKKWRDSSNGPDCLDVMTILQAIGTLHGGHVALIVSPNGTGSPTSVELVASILMDTLPGSDLPTGIGAHAEWPNRRSTSFWGEAYALAWALDEEVSKAYKQMGLPE